MSWRTIDSSQDGSCDSGRQIRPRGWKGRPWLPGSILGVRSRAEQGQITQAALEIFEARIIG